MPSTLSLDTHREAAGQRLLQYLQTFPLPVEQRLQLALDILRELPTNAGPSDAIALLQSRLIDMRPMDFPPAYPAFHRSHMVLQKLGRRSSNPLHARSRSASRRGLVVLLVFLATMLCLTLLLSMPQH